MSINKFTYDEALYKEIEEFLIELNKTPTSLTKPQMVKLHQLSTRIGLPSRPSGCGACNSRARRNIQNYFNTFKEIHNGEN